MKYLHYRCMDTSTLSSAQNMINWRIYDFLSIILTSESCPLTRVLIEIERFEAECICGWHLRRPFVKQVSWYREAISISDFWFLLSESGIHKDSTWTSAALESGIFICNQLRFYFLVLVLKFQTRCHLNLLATWHFHSRRLTRRNPTRSLAHELWRFPMSSTVDNLFNYYRV